MPGPKTVKAAAKKLSNYEMDLLTLHGLKEGSLRRGAGETTEDLIERIEREGSDILVIGEGSIPIMCAIFDQSFDVIEALVESSPRLTAARQQGEEIDELRTRESRDAALALKEFALKRLREEPRLITHSDDWPEDPELFHVELEAVMEQALRDYNGDPIRMSEPMSLTIPEIESAIAVSPKFQRLQEICQNKDDAEVVVNFWEKAATGTAAGAYRWLANRQPEKFSDKQQIDVKNVGFQPPPSDFGRGNALFGNQNKESEE